MDLGTTNFPRKYTEHDCPHSRGMPKRRNRKSATGGHRSDNKDWFSGLILRIAKTRSQWRGGLSQQLMKTGQSSILADYFRPATGQQGRLGANLSLPLTHNKATDTCH